MSLYLDNSVLVPLYVIEPATAVMEGWMGSRDEALIVSDLAVGEFGSATSQLVRMGRMALPEAEAIRADFDQWRAEATQPLSHDPSDIRTAARFVRRPLPKLLMPDAIHLATCQRLGLTLVTLDRDLAEIAVEQGLDTVVPHGANDVS